MHHRGVATIEPAVADGGNGAFAIVVVPGHYRVAAHDDLAERPAIVRDFAAVTIHHAELSTRHELDALAGLDFGTGTSIKSRVFRPWFTNGDKRRYFS